MKKLMLLCAGFMLAGVIAVNAQSSDTTARPSKAPATQPAPQESNQMTQKKDMVKVQTADVPASLRKTLADPMYVGWENSTIWRNKTTDEYTVELLSGNTTKTYRFDKSGKPIKDF
jgi:hypothetical protein